MQIAQHDPTPKHAHPLFLFYAFHLLHTPLQIPEKYLEKMDAVVAAAGGAPFDTSNRRKYAAMALYLDEAVGMVVRGCVCVGACVGAGVSECVKVCLVVWCVWSACVCLCGVSGCVAHVVGVCLFGA